MDSSFTVSDGEDLPRESSGHCLLKVNNSADGQEYVMLGGYPYSTEVHYINLNDANPEWTNLANMPDSKKGAYCGYIEDDDGSNRRIIMAAGGDYISHVP